VAETAAAIAGRGRGSGGDDTVRWRRTALSAKWFHQVLRSRAIAVRGDGGSDDGAGACARTDALANSKTASESVALLNIVFRTIAASPFRAPKPRVTRQG